MKFHLGRQQVVSSQFLPNWQFLNKFSAADEFDIIATTNVNTDTLDNQLRENEISDVDFVKLDMQGSELFILEGGAGILSSSVFGIEVEVGFAPRYCNQPLFSDVDQFVRRFGFQLLDLCPHYWKRKDGKSYGKRKGQLIYAEALYLKTAEDFQRVLDPIRDITVKKSKILRALSVCMVYGYFDYALELFTTLKDLFNQEECQAFWGVLKRKVSLASAIPSFRGKGRIANAAYGLSRTLDPDQKHYATTMKNALGNL